MSVNTKNEKHYKIEPESELRIELDENYIGIIELKSGTAEIFGNELVVEKSIIIYPGSKFSIYSWHGASLVLKVENLIDPTDLVNQDDIAYVSQETPMICYVNTHAVLERMRRAARDNLSRGPRIMIVGPSDVGKTTLSLILLNYAVRMGWKPIFVDLDVGQGSISIPGTISAIQVEKTIESQECWNLYSNIAAPMVIHYGRNSPGDNINLYRQSITHLAEIIDKKCTEKPKINQSGVIINTCGWVKQQGYLSLTHAAQAFEVDIVIVLDQERLYTELKRDLPPFVKVVLLPKSGGVVSRSKAYRSTCRDKRVCEYFYGHSFHSSSLTSANAIKRDDSDPLSQLPKSFTNLLNDETNMEKRFYPHSFEIKFNEIKLFRLGNRQDEILPDSCLPIGTKMKDQTLSVLSVPLTQDLKHHLASLSMSATDSEEDILKSNIAGFVCITDVNLDRETITVLSPQPRPLPYSILLLSEIQFVDYV